MKNNMKKTLQQKQGGFALLLAIIISSVVLAIGLSILNISVNQINLSATARESELAFQTAHGGMDCIWYWRIANASYYSQLDPTLPAIDCFGSNPIDSNETTLLSNSNGHIKSYEYTFEWGDPLRCTDVEMVVFNATAGDLSWTFDNQGVGNDGLKECQEGNVCTVLFSQGYNRSCTELATSIFSVQRELVVEF
jgi:hypothetical protein